MNKKLVVDYIPLANSIAIKKKKNLPRHISLDELKSAAYLGLINASIKYDPLIGSFYNYASIRINGSIKDHLKSLIHNGINNSEQEIDVLILEKNNTDTNDFFDFVSSKINASEYKIIKMYYIECRTMKEIADFEEVSESRISQIISKSLVKLRNTLKEV